MNEYFLSVISISVISAVITLIIPNEKKTGKYIKYIIGMITILTLVRPFTENRDPLPSFPEIKIPTDTEDPRKVIVRNTEKILEEDITRELFTRFRISKDHCSVKITMNSEDYENIYPENIRIRLKSYGAWGDKGAIESYFSEKYFCDAEVIYE